MRKLSSIVQLLLVISIQYVYATEAVRLIDKMYTKIESSICFRRLNGTHSTGCGSTFGGSVGVLHLIEHNHDFEFVINSPPAPPYTLVIPPVYFTRENILNVTAKALGNIAGIVLIENRTNLFSFSQESKCPNQYGGLLGEQTCDRANPDKSWNPFGTGLLHENFPFPIIYVKEEQQIENILSCYRKFNGFDLPNQHKRSLCGIQIKTLMSAAVSSEVCMRRTQMSSNLVNPPRYCDPLQSNNVYATLFPRPSIQEADSSNDTLLEIPSKEEIILIAARIDTTSMFDGVGPGAMDSLLPAITLMSTAHTLSKMFKDKSESSSLKNVLFMLFNGESYDYIGSQRFVYDIEKGKFPSVSTLTQPLHLENIKLFIDLGSLDSLNATTVFQYEHFQTADDLYNQMRGYNESLKLNIAIDRNTSHSLPPTSAQTFLRDNQTFPAVIFYSNANKNKFYHSIYDDNVNIDFHYKNTSKDFTELFGIGEIPQNFTKDSVQIGIRNFASLLAVSIYTLISGNKYDGDLMANPYLIDELLYCYLESAKCPLFRASVKDPNSLHVNPPAPQRYISVANSLSFETVGWTYSVLGFLTGRQTANHDRSNCTQLPFSWFAGFDGKGQCLRTTQNLTNAFSPAFLIENYDWKSGRYSTWTESTWSEINVRMFVKPSVSHEAFTLAIGFATLFLSFVAVFLINSKSDVLFGESTSSINVLTLPAQC